MQLQLANAGPESEIVLLFLRACELGLASGCTNYAAYLWRESAEASDQLCAQSIFEATCKARDHFGCGMFGRMLVDSGIPQNIERGRKVLETACDDMGGFVCRILALELERGRLGALDPARIKPLLKRACAGGDPDACGDAATAAETFHR